MHFLWTELRPRSASEIPSKSFGKVIARQGAGLLIGILQHGQLPLNFGADVAGALLPLAEVLKDAESVRVLRAVGLYMREVVRTAHRAFRGPGRQEYQRAHPGHQPPAETWNRR